MTAAPVCYHSEEEVSLKLQHLESEHDLLRFEVDGWCAWPVLRYDVSRSIQNHPFDINLSVHFPKRELLRIAIRDVLRLTWRSRHRYIAKTYSSVHNETENGREKDIFFDDVLRTIPGGCKLETIDKWSYYTNSNPRLVPSLFRTVSLEVAAGKLARHMPPPRELTEVSNAISAVLQTELGLEKYTPRCVMISLASFHWLRRLYRTLLRWLNAPFLLLLETDHAPIAAARELGMQVIELQHGSYPRYYPAKSWSRYALPYKTRMPLPHRIFTYGPYWSGELAALGFWQDELRSVGSVRIDQYRAQKAQRADELCCIAVTTQGMDTQRLIAFMDEFIRLAEGRVPCRVYFKMHPRYHNSHLAFHEVFKNNPHVQLVGSNESPTTFELLQLANLHLSISSTCHYEALALGVPTVILPLETAETVAHLREAGHAFFAKTPRELVDIAARWRNYKVPNDIGKEYFAFGALNNLKRELQTLSSASNYVH